jgi:hypothetical protein
MPNFAGGNDLTTNNLPNSGPRIIQTYRPYKTAASYVPGTVLQLVSLDNQLYPDWQTVQPLPAGTTLGKIAGVVSERFVGFAGSINTTSPPPVGAYQTTTVAAPYLQRGTQFIEAVCKGFARVLVDQSGASAVTLTDGLPIVSSRNSAGYGQGLTLFLGSPGYTIGLASLPASGIGSSITAAALAQATQTFTVTTPASGDTLNAVIQSPYSATSPGVVQTITYSLTLNATTAASVTTAAAAMVAYLNSQTSFSTYFTATNVAGVITVTVNANSVDFLVTYGSGSTLTGQWYVPISGMVANTLTTTASVTGAGGTGFAAGGGTFSGGTGFKGLLPAWIQGEF